MNDSIIFLAQNAYNIMNDTTDARTLRSAVRSKSKEEILKALSNVRQEDLKVTDKFGNTVLHLVLINDILSRKEIIELLEIFILQGIDIYAENKHGKTVLHRAIQCRMKSVVDFLISREVDISRCDSKGDLITHNFVVDESEWFYGSLERRHSRFQRMDSVELEGESVKFLDRADESDREAQEDESASFTEFLIERGFDFDLKNKQGTSALHLAIERNLLHILHVLVKHTRDIQFVDHREKSLLQLFIERKAVYRDERKNLQKDWYPEYASRYSANIVRILLDRGISTWPHDGDRHCTSLQTAVEYQEDTNIINMLIDHGLKSMEDYSATEMFAELFKIYLWCGVSKTGYFWTGLFGLITEGADVNAKDESGMTPMYHAFLRKNVSAVLFLIDRQADFDTITDFDENLFHALARINVYDKQTIDTLEVEALFDLVAKKACCDINEGNSSNETPLHWAARCGNLVIAKKLVENGAEVNCRDVNGSAPLHHAVCHSKSEELTKLLLESGAEINIKDKCGRRPLSMAVDAADKLVSLLLKRGAYVNAYKVSDLPFWKIILQDNCRIANEMLAYGADVNNNDAVLCSLFESKVGTSWKSDESLQSKKFLLKHWVKLKVANLLCSSEYEAHVKTDDCQAVSKDCLKEIPILKNTFIDSRTSIYRFLHMDFCRRRRCINSEKLRKLVQSTELEEQFPNYSVVILASYRETVLWKSLLEPAKRAWLKITGFRLPDECLEPIFAHLINEDLINMIECNEDV